MLNEKAVSAMHPLQLAYIGDAAYGLLIRSMLVEKGGKLKELHRQCTDLVRASAQAAVLSDIMPLLTEEETEVVRKGRNAHAKHAAPRSATVTEYTQSTAFEALIGFLYLTGKKHRIIELLMPVIGPKTEE